MCIYVWELKDFIILIFHKNKIKTYITLCACIFRHHSQTESPSHWSWITAIWDVLFGGHENATEIENMPLWENQEFFYKNGEVLILLCNTKLFLISILKWVKSDSTSQLKTGVIWIIISMWPLQFVLQPNN